MAPDDWRWMHIACVVAYTGSSRLFANPPGTQHPVRDRLHMPGQDCLQPAQAAWHGRCSGPLPTARLALRHAYHSPSAGRTRHWQ